MAAELLSAAQRAKIFAMAKERNLDADQLRARTPRGHVSDLTHDEAASLIHSLVNNTSPDYSRRPDYRRRPDAPRRPRRPGVHRMISEEQLAMITALRMELGWTVQGLHEHLAARHYRDDPKRPLSDYVSSTDGVTVIEHLKKVRDRKAFYAERRQRSASATSVQF